MYSLIKQFCLISPCFPWCSVSLSISLYLFQTNNSHLPLKTRIHTYYRWAKMSKEKIFFLSHSTTHKNSSFLSFSFFYRIYRCMLLLLLLFSFEYLLFSPSVFVLFFVSNIVGRLISITLPKWCDASVYRRACSHISIYLSIWKTVRLLCRKRYDWQTD